VPARLLEFDEFSLDCDRYELLRSGQPVKLEKIPMELLILLVTKDGCLVTRQEIIEHLWGAEVFVDTEHGINTAIRKIRNVLRDDPEQPRFVQTIPRKGYRFIATVKVIPRAPGNGNHNGIEFVSPETTQTQAEGHVPSPLPRSHYHLGRLLRKAALVLVGAIGIVVVLVGLNVRVRGRLFAHAGKPRIHSLAVLPLENLSGDPAQEYFADGMTDELITMLAKNVQFRVISRTSVMRYKNVRRPLREIAGELGADGILEGSIARRGNRVHVTAQLIHAASDTHVWAESYDRDLNDISSLQSEVAQTVARQAGATVSLPAKPEKPVNPEAYEAYLKGRYFANIRGPTVGKAAEYYQLAIEKEPTFALAYAGLAESQWRGEDFAAAKRSAEKALELDGTMGEPLATLAQIKAYNDWDFRGAEEDYKRAITLSPNYPPARQWYAQFLDWMGRLDEAMVQIEIGQQLDPLSLIMSTDRAEILLHMDKLDAAKVQIKKVLELNPAFETAPVVLGEIYEREGKYDAALAEYKEMIRLTGQREDYEGVSVVIEARLRAEAGRKKEATQLLTRAEQLLAKRPPPEPCGQALASAYAALGDKNNAFMWLQRDYAVRWPDMITLKMDKTLDPLRSDPRFADLLKRVGFPQ
jgi:TolB-like protein/DNA-binding winged helix-turn-helix (wHTH) protein/Tfp pilus assembly protein PilF